MNPWADALGNRRGKHTYHKPQQFEVLIMGTRGRKSAAELAIAQVVEVQPRPAAPEELADEEAREWEDIVSRMPAKWFTRATWPLLMQLCRHVVAARRVAQLIHKEEQSDKFDLIKWDRLLRAQERQSALVASLSTKMRLTPQSRYGPRACVRSSSRMTSASSWIWLASSLRNRALSPERVFLSRASSRLNSAVRASLTNRSHFSRRRNGSSSLVFTTNRMMDSPVRTSGRLVESLAGIILTELRDTVETKPWRVPAEPG